MGWATELTTTLLFNHKTYTNKYHVEGDLDEVKENINKIRQSLIALAVTTEPAKVINVEDGESVIDVVVESANELMNSLMEQTCEKDMLERLLDEWNDCHEKDGKPRHTPKGFEPPYIDGDFIDESND